MLLTARCAPTATPTSAGSTSTKETSYNVYFGDLHVHTSRIHQADTFAEEFSREQIEAANSYARDVMYHDFVSVTNHGYLLEDWMWEVTKEVADEFTQDGVFTSFPAFEWTASHPCGRHCDPPRQDYPAWGHRCVHFRDTNASPLRRCNDPNYDTPMKLFGALPGPDFATTIPHHTSHPVHPFDWSTINPAYDRLVEIVQFRDSYETDIIQNGWASEQILGVVGGSDNHNGRPGKPRGITAILAPALTRDALFDALRDRRTYATSHGDIILHFFGDGAIQGSILTSRSSVTLGGEIDSKSETISLVELLIDGQVITSWQPNQATFRFEERQWLGEEQHYFYVRVTLKNGHQAWSSPIWVNNHFIPTAPSWPNLGQVLAFLAHDVRPRRLPAGETLHVTLFWQALGDMDRDYSAFIHVVGDDDRIWAQQDAMLQHGDYPTSSWNIGQTVKGEYELQLAQGTPPGEYTVKAGVYYWETGERLPVWDESGQRLPGDTMVLDHIRITD